jgi:hypothetical protein
MDGGESKVYQYQYILGNINFTLQTATKKKQRKNKSSFMPVHTLLLVHDIHSNDTSVLTALAIIRILPVLLI